MTVLPFSQSKKTVPGKNNLITAFAGSYITLSDYQTPICHYTPTQPPLIEKAAKIKS
jgi:hypothetical protein